jgi:hypothetical protein
LLAPPAIIAAMKRPATSFSVLPGMTKPGIRSNASDAIAQAVRI